MEFLVVDASVAVKWVLNEPGREPALRLVESQQSSTLSLTAPSLLLAEVAGFSRESTGGNN